MEKWLTTGTRIINGSLILRIIISLYILLFLYAATSKLAGYQAFELQIRKSPFISRYAGVLAWLVPLLEILISLLLTQKRMVLIGLWGALTLMSSFTFYIYGILHFSQDIPCSCGGLISRMGWQDHLIFNIVFVVLAIAGIWLQGKVMNNNRPPGAT